MGGGSLLPFGLGRFFLYPSFHISSYSLSSLLLPCFCRPLLWLPRGRHRPDSLLVVKTAAFAVRDRSPCFLSPFYQLFPKSVLLHMCSAFLPLSIRLAISFFVFKTCNFIVLSLLFLSSIVTSTLPILIVFCVTIAEGRDTREASAGINQKRKKYAS